jgi:hypothetical protein
MKPKSIRFHCPRCNARIKADARLTGQSRDCPGCDHPLTVPRFVPVDAGPVLVLIEGEESCGLGVAYRRGA